MAVLLNGADVTALCSVPNPDGGGRPIQWTRRGGRASSLTIEGPGDLLGGSVGTSTLELTGIGAGFQGTVWRIDDEADENHTQRKLTAYDSLIYLPKRIVKDGEDSTDPRTGEPDPGNFSDPSIIQDNLYGPAIMAAAIENSNALDGAMGPLGLGVGGVTLANAIDLSGFRPSTWPMTLEDLRKLLVDAGVLDIKMSGSNAQLYEGNAGDFVNQPFEYDTGSKNCRAAKRSIDMENVFNVVWTLLGQKEPLYDGDVQHWKGNVTIDDTGTKVIAGVPTYVGIPDPPYSSIAGAALASRSTYGRLQRIDEYDFYQDERTPAAKRPLRRLAQMLWLSTSLYCATPRTLVTMTPEAGITPSFDVYDTIPVAAGASLGGGFSGEQRVYEFTVDIDTEGNPELSKLVTSADMG